MLGVQVLVKKIEENNFAESGPPELTKEGLGENEYVVLCSNMFCILGCVCVQAYLHLWCLSLCVRTPERVAQFSGLGQRWESKISEFF